MTDAYRMLGSTSEAEDAVQEPWLRLNGSDARKIENLGGEIDFLLDPERLARLDLSFLGG